MYTNFNNPRPFFDLQFLILFNYSLPFSLLPPTASTYPTTSVAPTKSTPPTPSGSPYKITPPPPSCLVKFIFSMKSIKHVLVQNWFDHLIWNLRLLMGSKYIKDMQSKYHLFETPQTLYLFISSFVLC